MKSNAEIKTLVLVRHAHRDTMIHDLDNGLSERGKKQAKEVLKAFHAHWKQENDLALISSPKRRCIETLDPIAQEVAAKVEISSWLDEQERSESTASFMGRISQFIAWWKEKAPALTIACSHGDWLPVCTAELIGTQVSFEKGAWIVLVVQDDQVQLQALRQN
jgi:broad specificity phosphatase PhoE